MSNAARVCVVGGSSEELAAIASRVGAEVRVIAQWESVEGREALAWADAVVVDGVAGAECDRAQEQGALVVSRGGAGDLVVVGQAAAEEWTRHARGGLVRLPTEFGRAPVALPDELLGRVVALGRDCVIELDDDVVVAVVDGRVIGVPGMGGPVGSAAFLAMLAARWAEHRVGGVVDAPAVADALDWACAARAEGKDATRVRVRDRLLRSA